MSFFSAVVHSDGVLNLQGLRSSCINSDTFAFQSKDMLVSSHLVTAGALCCDDAYGHVIYLNYIIL